MGRHFEGTLADAIGRAFERRLQDAYPFLVRNPTGSNLPDFETDGFYLEAKAHYREYGGRIKWEQMQKFHSLPKPVFYMYGCHDIKGLSKVPKAVAFDIASSMRFDDLTLMDNDFIENFFAMEQRFAAKQGPNCDNHYCIIKPRHIRQILRNETISRNGTDVSARDFYGVDRREWDMFKVNGIQLLVRKERFGIIESLIP